MSTWDDNLRVFDVVDGVLVFLPTGRRVVLKEHLGGKHNQKTHGRHGKVGFEGMEGREAEIAAVKRWQSSYGSTDFIQENPDSDVARAFESAVMGAPLVQGTVYRGFNDYSTEPGYAGPMTAKESAAKWQAQVGKDVRFNEFKSTSPDLDTARNFGPAIFEIHGARAHDISGMSVYPDFKEAVMEPGTFRVTGVRAAPTDHPIFGDLVQFGPATLVTLQVAAK